MRRACAFEDFLTLFPFSALNSRFAAWFPILSRQGLQTLKEKDRALVLKEGLSEFSTWVFDQSSNPVPHTLHISEKRKRRPPISGGAHGLTSERRCLLIPGKRPESRTAAQPRVLPVFPHL